MQTSYFSLGICLALTVQGEPLKLKVAPRACREVSIPSWTHVTEKPLRLKSFQGMSGFEFRRLETFAPTVYLVRNDYRFDPDLGRDWQVKEIWKVDFARPGATEAATESQWEAARENPWLLNRFSRRFTAAEPTRIVTTAPTSFVYAGRTYEPLPGFQWSDTAADPSPGKKMIVRTMIKIPTKPSNEKHERFNPVRAGDKGTIAWVFHLVATGEEVARVVADYKNAEPSYLLGSAQWLSDTLYFMPNDRNGLRPLVCSFDSK